eukprot:7643183-Ditylum_brightwellii.AAC.1
MESSLVSKLTSSSAPMMASSWAQMMTLSLVSKMPSSWALITARSGYDDGIKLPSQQIQAWHQ